MDITIKETPARTPILEWRPTRQFIWAFVSICMLCLTMALDSSILTIALATISADLEGSAIQAFWAVTGFLLASAVFQPTVTALSEIFGRASLLYGTGLLFGVGTIMGGAANSFATLIAGRVLQGAGAGGITALSEVIITDLVPLSQRGQWLGYVSLSWAVGSVIGPLIGAGFTQNVSWRWVFWINLPPLAAGLTGVMFFLKLQFVPGGAFIKLARFDWIGSFLFSLGSAGFLFGLSAGGVMFAWTSSAILIPILVGIALLCVFGVFDLRYATHPIMHPGLFSNRDMIISYILSAFNGAVLGSVVYFMILYYQAVKLYSPVISAVAGMPETLTIAPGAAITGIVVGKTGRYRWAVWLSMALTAMGCGLLYLCGPETSVPAWIFINVPVGLGLGIAITALTIAIQAACRPDLNGIAAAFNPFVRTFGQAVGIAMAGVVLQNRLATELLDVPGISPATASKYSRDATALVEVIHHMPAGVEQLALQVAYVRSLRFIWIILAALCVGCLLLSTAIRGYSLNQEHVSNQKLESITEK